MDESHEVRRLCQNKCKIQESAKNEQQQQILSEFCKINPEGTCGPIWSEVVPFSSSSHWLYYCVKKFVDMCILKSDILSDLST